jgi:hypothetical protein
MATITQYRPGFFSGFQNQVVEFSTLEELLNIPFVGEFKCEDIPGIKFYQFSIDKCPERKGCPYSLIAEYRSGYVWYVVGHMDENDIIKELPEFVPKYSGSKKNEPQQ